MKILSIKGKNLASIEGEFHIDFRSEPLRSAGIFAITGSTGAGKTTLLDAMCIALFYKSPRTHKAKANKSTEKEENLKENDCRNILRHGTGEGYAEVEFLALNGKEYRSRWSVNRARNSSNGNIQAAKYELFCITDNQFLTNSKKENEKTIERLVGLNYEQFTRAVLLAQGEFSAFLKASPNEKADILEKLTGTEIYARISERIYQKSKEADIALNIIVEQQKGINLLTPEEAIQLEEEKNFLHKEAQKDETVTYNINEKIKWIERKAHLEQEISNAHKNIIECKAALEVISATIKTLQLIDKIQPIRDTFIDYKRTVAQTNRDITLSEEEAKILQNKEKQYNDAEKSLQEIIAQKEKIEKQKEDTEPLLHEATKHETERNNFRSRLKEVEQTLKESTEQYTKNRAEYIRTEEEHKKLLTEQQNIAQWLEKNSIYSPIIPHCDLLSISIQDAKVAEQQIASQATVCKKAVAQQELFEQHLLAAKEETEKLKATLTLEIATLRSQLVEGEPCPICGSTHHSITTTTVNILKEKELKEARKENEKNIERLNKSIENVKAEIASCLSSIEAYKNVKRQRIECILSIIKNIPECSTLNIENTSIDKFEDIINKLVTVAKEWNKNNNRAVQLEQEISVQRSTLANTESKIKELKANITSSNETIDKLKDDILKCDKQISTILGSAKDISEIREYFTNEIAKYGKLFSECTLQRNNIRDALTSTQEKIKMLQERIEESKKKSAEQDKEIQNFLSSEKSLDITQLEELTKISIEECNTMRRKIDTAEKNLLQAETTLKERERNIEQHLQATTKPSEEENIESLTLQLQEFKQQATLRLEQITQITAKLKTDKENKQRYQKLLKEYKEKEKYAYDWKCLCEAFGSAKGEKFRLIAQGYTLDIMLSYANMHLKQLSSRYQLVRTAPDSLALMIIDLDMLSEQRTINTLSGGETFLVSLAMALALSSLSSSNMNIESLFIDEGFGSLDSETLRVAMDALEHLQSQGRKVGVISHLSNMIERIPTQICVTKKRGGRSTVEIKSNY